MSKTFRGGVPYAVDVRRLIDAFPVLALTEGRVIRHDELESVITAEWGTQRYYGVVNAWIREMKNANSIYIIWEWSVGITVLDPAKLLIHAETKTRQKMRQTGRAMGIHRYVDRARLDSLGQQRLDHYRRVADVFAQAMRAAKKDLAISISPIQSLPKPTIIQ